VSGELEQFAANMQPSLDLLRKLENDALNYGIAVVYGGNRVDPNDFYVTPPSPRPSKDT
jgi:hypothetical protein